MYTRACRGGERGGGEGEHTLAVHKVPGGGVLGTVALRHDASASGEGGTCSHHRSSVSKV